MGLGGSRNALSDRLLYHFEAPANRVRISRQHRLNSMPGDLGQIGVVDASTRMCVT